MSNISCISCRVTFSSMEERDNHFRLPWHSYNVKRKVHGLEPVSEEVFIERQKLLEESEQSNKENVRRFCEICKKTFSNENTLNNHLQSKKHLDAMKAKLEREQKTGIIETPKDHSSVSPRSPIQSNQVNNNDAEEELEEEMEEEEEKPRFVPEEFEPNSCRCLFCRVVAKTTEENLLHMSKFHSFVIPDFEFVDDLDGLLQYLGEKISRGCICLYCNRGFHDPYAVRQHMLDSAHCRIKYEEDDEVDEYAPFYDYSEQNEEGIDEDDIEVHYTGELQLPDGRLLGNRSLFRYYKQKFAPQDSNRRILINKLLLEYHEQRNTPSSALIKYTPKQVSERQKQLQVQRVDAYHQRLRLDAGLRINKIHLDHFSHR